MSDVQITADERTFITKSRLYIGFQGAGGSYAFELHAHIVVINHTYIYVYMIDCIQTLGSTTHQHDHCHWNELLNLDYE